LHILNNIGAVDAMQKGCSYDDWKLLSIGLASARCCTEC